MKETYSQPTIVNADVTEASGLAPWGVIAAAAATAAGYAAGRAVTKAVRAIPSIQLPALPRARRVADDF